jgi:hypothetical protein
MEKLQEKDQLCISGDGCPEFRLRVKPENFPLFTTILQSGVETVTRANTSLGKFLIECPGFSEKYLAETVQTIFLNSTAVDDMQTPLRGSHPVVALSAAMPGLAGAIFRKGGFHASLRTATRAEISGMVEQGPLTVTLKLFNSIAREKGELLLRRGAVMASTSVDSFLEKRPELRSRIEEAVFNGKPVGLEDLRSHLLRYRYVKLFVVASALT